MVEIKQTGLIVSAKSKKTILRSPNHYETNMFLLMNEWCFVYCLGYVFESLVVIENENSFLLFAFNYMGPIPLMEYFVTLKSCVYSQNYV